MTTQLAVANLALAHLMVGKPIGAMTDATQPARVMTQCYGQARDEVFRDFNWPFARRFAQLVVVAGPTPPASIDFAYSYRYPAGALALRDVISGPRRPGAPFASSLSIFGIPDAVTQRLMPPHTPYQIGGDGTGLLIYCDVIPDTTNGLPVAEYTVQVDESQWAADFAAAVAFKLAWYTAPLLTAGDPHKLGDRALGAYFDLLSRARAAARNEQQDDVDPDAGAITARY